MKNIENLLHVLLIFIGLLSLNAQAGVEITYIHNDAMGSSVAGTDEQGNVKWRSHYQPYGEERLGERQLFGVRSGYTGHREDPETGLTYMGARYYSPMIGRFMGVDPAGVDEGNIHSFNRYAYANNNPYRFVDPDGRAAETAVDIVSLGLSVEAFRSDPSFINGLGLAYDGLATVVPFLPAGFGIIKNVGSGIDAIGDATKNAKVHANKIDDRPATLYEKYDKDGNFLKHGVTKHEDPTKRYTRKQIDGGTVVRTDRGPRREMIKKERDLVERNPGPDNREPWAGKRSGE